MGVPDFTPDGITQHKTGSTVLATFTLGSFRESTKIDLTQYPGATLLVFEAPTKIVSLEFR